MVNDPKPRNRRFRNPPDLELDVSGKRLLQIATDPAGNPLSFAYDTLARMTTRTDAESRTYQFSYDALSRISTVTDPMLNVADTRTYTENGMLASRQDAAANVTLMYTMVLTG